MSAIKLLPPLRAESILDAIGAKGIHDLEGKIRQISGFSQLSWSDTTATDEEKKVYHENINSGCETLKIFVERTKQFLSISSRRVVRNQFEDASELVAALKNSIRTHGENTDLVWDLQTSHNSPFEVDSSILKEILVEALDNAERYADSPVTVTVKVIEPLRLAIRLQDSGPGIETSQVARLADPYQRGVTPQHSLGAGLGLPICRLLTERLGGTIGIKSQRDSGFTLFLDVPIGKS